MTTTLTKTETTAFLNELEAIYDEPSVTYKIRTTSKWVAKSFKERSILERLASIDLASRKCYQVQPKNPNPPPIHNIWLERLWLTCTISPALIIQALWYHFIPKDNYYHTWHPLFTFIFYFLAFLIFTLQLAGRAHYYMKHYGTFDEENRPRDYVPDKLVPRFIFSVLIYLLARTGGGLILGGYNRNEPPSLGRTISWFFIIKIGLWLIVLDFFFYSYHRAVHTVPFLWKIHSLHHCSKHPTPIQSILAGDIQDLIEIFLIPLITSLVLPLTAHEFWIAQCILIYTEAGGHSGIRAYFPHVILYEVLLPFDMELCIEDHDIHHRYGKSGMNYANCVSPYIFAPSGGCVNVLLDVNNRGTIDHNCTALNYSSCSIGICSNAPGNQLANNNYVWTASINGQVDGAFYGVTLPFNITIYDITTNFVYVLCFGTCATTYTETALPTTAFSGVTVLAYWDDLYFYSSISQGIYYGTEGNAPNHTLIFEFYMSHFSQPSQYYHFQVVFFEGVPGVVQFKYYDASDGGVTCTIGVQASTSGSFVQYLFDLANSVQSRTMLTFDTNLRTYTNSTF
ncbi:unnamed protein product [Rotaria sp. Silwood1]|nr:unnamed protein product [Rotaria sp. Silwood1]